MNILGHSGKKVAFKAFKNLAICGLLLGYNIHLINEKIVHDQSFVESIKNDYQAVSSSLADCFINILKSAEGVSSSFYPDNKGYAVGYGFNPTQNTAQYNKSILEFAQVDPIIAKFIIEHANDYKNTQTKGIPEEFKNIKFTPEQINKMAIFAKQSYEKDFYSVLKEKIEHKGYNGAKEEKLLKSYQDLPSNQKAVLIHMVYKVGSNNLRKYNTFFSNFINYLDNPSVENKEKVATQFIYHYKSQGKDLLDNRVSKIHYQEFMRDIPVEKLVENVPAKPQPELSDKEKFDKATKEVRQDMLDNFSIKNIWAYLQKNKKENELYEKEHGSEMLKYDSSKRNTVSNATNDKNNITGDKIENNDESEITEDEEEDNGWYIIESTNVTVKTSNKMK